MVHPTSLRLFRVSTQKEQLVVRLLPRAFRATRPPCLFSGEAITEKTIYGYTFGPHWSVSLMVNLLLFAGMFLCMILDWIVHKLAPETKDLAPEHAAPEKPVEERKPAEMRAVTSLPVCQLSGHLLRQELTRERR